MPISILIRSGHSRLHRWCRSGVAKTHRSRTFVLPCPIKHRFLFACQRGGGFYRARMLSPAPWPALRAIYHVTAPNAAELDARVESLLLEQTVELPRKALRNPFVLGQILGRLAGMEEIAPHLHRVTIDFPIIATADDPRNSSMSSSVTRRCRPMSNSPISSSRPSGRDERTPCPAQNSARPACASSSASRTAPSPAPRSSRSG